MRAGAEDQFLVLKIEGVLADGEAESELLVGHGQSLAKYQALVHSDLHLPRGRSHHRRHEYLVSLILLVNITGQGHIRKVTGTFRTSEEILISYQQLNVGSRNSANSVKEPIQ